jgi:hypothetical protein
VITVKVIDDRELLKDPVVGYLSVDLAYLLRAKEEQREWFPLTNAKTGRIRLTAEWKPLAMAGSVQGAAAYVPPIGVVRLWYVFCAPLSPISHFILIPLFASSGSRRLLMSRMWRLLLVERYMR